MGPVHNVSNIVGNAALHEHFVGYERLDVKPDTNSTLHDWFALWDLNGGQPPRVAGGFVVTVDAAKLFGGM